MSELLSGTNRHGESYGFGRTTLAVLGATLLVGANILVMLVIAPTEAAEAVIWLYASAPFAPLGGLIVMSGLLSAGRFTAYTALGFNPVEPEETYRPRDVSPSMAVVGLIVTMLAFGLFGGAGLSLVPAEMRGVVLGVSLAITGGLTLVAGGAELITERSLAGPGEALMAFGMLGGIGLFLIGYVLEALGAPFAGPVFGLAFAAIVLGWIGDLVHEISVLSRNDRSPLVNAFGLYAAVTGVLVHVIWMVVRAAAEE